jgi:hypothetical protein
VSVRPGQRVSARQPYNNNKANQECRAQRAPVLQRVGQPGEGLGPNISLRYNLHCQRERTDTTGKYLVRRSLRSVQFDFPEGDFIIYRLLVAQPWPERLADPSMRAV